MVHGDMVISMGVPRPLPGEPRPSAPAREEDMMALRDLIGGDAIPISPDSIFCLQSTINSSTNWREEGRYAMSNVSLKYRQLQKLPVQPKRPFRRHVKEETKPTKFQCKPYAFVNPPFSFPRPYHYRSRWSTARPIPFDWWIFRKEAASTSRCPSLDLPSETWSNRDILEGRNKTEW